MWCRRGMYNFLLSVKQPDGSFIMHIGGDLDVRYARPLRSLRQLTYPFAADAIAP